MFCAFRTKVLNSLENNFAIDNLLINNGSKSSESDANFKRGFFVV